MKDVDYDHPNAPTTQQDTSIETPPFNDDAERSALGAAFVDARAFYEVAEILDRKMLYRERHRKIYDALESVIVDRDQQADVINVADYLDNRDELDGVGGPAFLTRISNIVPSALRAAKYAEIVRREYRRRRQISIGNELAKESRKREDPDGPAAEAIDRLRDSADNSSTRKTSEETDDELGKFLERDDDRKRSTSTGIAELDRMTSGGVSGGHTWYVAGITKMGKTRLAIDISAHLLDKDWHVDFWTVEQPHREIEEMYLEWYNGISMESVWSAVERDGDLSRQQAMQDTLTEAREWFRSRDLEIEMRGEPKIRDIELQTRARLGQLSESERRKFMLVVDYGQNCTAGIRDQRVDLAQVSKSLNAIAKDQEIVLLVTWQMQNAAEDRWKKRRQTPDFSDIRGTSQIGNDANRCFIIHRPYADSDDENKQQYTKLVQALSRHGDGGREAELHADLARSRFTEWRQSHPASWDDDEYEESDSSGWE
jgi:replicative DNA helicase